MKAFFFLLVISLLSSMVIFSQVVFSSFYSFNYQHKLSDLSLKNEKPFGLLLGYEFGRNFGLSTQYRNIETWPFNEKIEKLVAIRSFSFHFYTKHSFEGSVKWFFNPMLGFFFGFGQTINKTDQGGRIIAGQEEFLDNPYFCGFLLQVNTVRVLDKNFEVGIFARTEGGFGIIANRPWGIQSNASTIAMFTTGTWISLKARKTKSG